MVTAADVEGERDIGVDLGVLDLREIAECAPVVIETLDRLRAALEEALGLLWRLPVDPRLDSIRREPWFGELVEPNGVLAEVKLEV